MSWSKLDFVKQAFEEIGYASYVFDAMPEQLNSVLITLDAMMATWNAKGIRVGYPLPGSPAYSDINQETEVPDASNEAIYLNLACRIAPRFGKKVYQDTKQAAKEAYDALLIKTAEPIEMQFPSTTPVGAGNKNTGTRYPFFPRPIDGLMSGSDNEINFD